VAVLRVSYLYYSLPVAREGREPFEKKKERGEKRNSCLYISLRETLTGEASESCRVTRKREEKKRKERLRRPSRQFLLLSFLRRSTVREGEEGFGEIVEQKRPEGRGGQEGGKKEEKKVMLEIAERPFLHLFSFEAGCAQPEEKRSCRKNKEEGGKKTARTDGPHIDPLNSSI